MVSGETRSFFNFARAVSFVLFVYLFIFFSFFFQRYLDSLFLTFPKERRTQAVKDQDQLDPKYLEDNDR